MNNTIFGTRTIKDLNNYIRSPALGIYSLVNTYLTDTKQYTRDGLNSKDAAINTAIDMVMDSLHTVSNAVFWHLTGRKINADMVLQLHMQ